MDDLPIEARNKGIALGGFECWNSESIRAVAEAAADCRMPVILQATHLEYGVMGGADVLSSIAELYVSKTGIDAGLHLDHGSSMEQVEECIAAGFTSVMMDASRLPLSENIALSRQATALAHAHNVSIEVELGHVGGAEGGGEGANDYTNGLTDPVEAEQFAAETGADCLAVGIGTAHGDYRGKPKLDLERFGSIAERVPIPLVLHGGSDTPADLLLKSVNLGITKINICTDIHKAWMDAIAEARTELTPSIPGLFHDPPHKRLKQKVCQMIDLFANGRSW